MKYLITQQKILHIITNKFLWIEIYGMDVKIRINDGSIKHYLPQCERLYERIAVSSANSKIKH